MSLGRVAAFVTALTFLPGCGSEGGGDARPSASRPPATVTVEPTPTITPGATATPAPTATVAPTTAPDEPDAGDEAGNRVRVELTLETGGIRPARIEVPAFLGLSLAVRNASGAERVVQLDGDTVLELLPGESETVDVEGLQPGEHALTAGASRALLVAERAR